MACSGCGGSVSERRVQPQVDVNGDPVAAVVQYPNGTVRKFWSADGVDAAVRDYGAALVSVDDTAREVVALPTGLPGIDPTRFDALDRDALKAALTVAGIEYADNIPTAKAIELLREADGLK